MNVGRADGDDADDANDHDDDGGRKMIIESIIILKIVFLDDCMSSMIIITMKGCDSSIDNITNVLISFVLSL